MRALLLLLPLILSACATSPPLPARPDFSHHPGIRDAADKLQTYYNYRLTREDGGYRYGQLDIPASALGAFMDQQGDTVAAQWARSGQHMIIGGWSLAAALEAAAIGVGALAASDAPARNAWWLGLLPAVGIGWTFHWVGDGTFRRPAVAHYDLQLKRELGLTRD